MKACPCRTAAGDRLGRRASEALLATLLGAFALLGLVLAAIGLYGVTSYSVSQRQGEFGIRMPLGAQARDVLRLVLGKGAQLVLSGVALALAGSYAVMQILAAAIPSVPTSDPAAIASVTTTLAVVAIVACWLPARRAVGLDPWIALKFQISDLSFKIERPLLNLTIKSEV